MQHGVESAARLPHDTPGALIAACGPALWRRRIGELAARAGLGPNSRRAIARRHAPEFAIDRLARDPAHPPGPAEHRLLSLLAALLGTEAALPAAGRTRLREALARALTGEGRLAGLLHLFHIAGLQRGRGFRVSFAGLAEAAPYDLLIERDGRQAEIACDWLSAEEGRDLHHAAWADLLDRVEPALQGWLAHHPGRHLLKMTLPQGLHSDGLHHGGPHQEGASPAGSSPLDTLCGRIGRMLDSAFRHDQDAAAVLRLEPLLLASPRDGMPGLLSWLRREFGSEARLAVTGTPGRLLVLAARAARQDEVAAALRRRLFAIAPHRLSGSRPGILALLLDDTDAGEWRSLRDRLELEGETRRFLAQQAARSVVAVSCTSRLELLGLGDPAAAPDGEWRFRNPRHPAAGVAALAPSVLSSM